ncbi:MAG: hypothetical protein K2W99_04270 [Chthoniobacterales bacterium]|nr:hypothetical protein [Chthoniobacterales bacterium]
MIAAAVITPPLPAMLPAHSSAAQSPHHAGSPGFNNTPDVSASSHLAAQQAPKIQGTTESLPGQVDSFYTRGVTHQVVVQNLVPVSPDGSALSTSLNTSSLSEELSYFHKKKNSSSSLNSAELLEIQAEMTEITIEYGFYGQLASKAASSIQTLFNNQV